MNLQEYERLQQQIDAASRESQRAAGARDQLMKELHNKWGVKTVEEARRLLGKKKKERDAADQKLKELMDNFEDEYNDTLEGLG